VAVATGMQSNTSVGTQQCPIGQSLVNGVCVPSGTQSTGTGTTATTPGTTATAATPPTLSSLYGDFRGAVQQTAEANIQSARQTAATQQDTLNRQLAEQRQDYLTNRQQLQKETFLRGRNILSNLANRGLATSGLLQLGDVQRTIATGQQMTGLSEAFERARQGITGQQQGIQTGLQQFEAGQQSQLAQQIAGLNLQERQAGVTESERSVAYAESLATLLSDPSIPQATKDALTPLYEQLITAPAPTTPTTPGETPAAPGGSFASNFGTPTIRTVTSLVDGVKGQGGKLSSFEENALIDVVSKSDMLNQDSPFMKDLAGVTPGTEVTATVRTKGGKAGLNDEYFVQLPSGQEYELEGRELAILLMNNAITVKPEIALSIAQRAGGGLATGLGVVGNRASSVIIPYLEWLKKNNINEKTVTNPIR
jgi:hypothetical protein